MFYFETVNPSVWSCIIILKVFFYVLEMINYFKYNLWVFKNITEHLKIFNSTINMLYNYIILNI